jgi:hypothetical protein
VAPLAPGPLARSQRAALRRALDEGLVELAAILRGDESTVDVERVALGMTVRDLLSHTTARDHLAPVLTAAGLAGDERLGDLPYRQRLHLARALEGAPAA